LSVNATVVLICLKVKIKYLRSTLIQQFQGTGQYKWDVASGKWVKTEGTGDAGTVRISGGSGNLLNIDGTNTASEWSFNQNTGEQMLNVHISAKLDGVFFYCIIQFGLVTRQKILRTVTNTF